MWRGLWCISGRFVLGILAGLWLGACAAAPLYQQGIFTKPDASFKAPQPTGFHVIKAKDADLVFWNDASQAFIMLNATCKDYRDAPPSALAAHLLIGIENREILKEAHLPVSGREAFYQEIRGLLDGVPVQFASYTLVKDYCTYDLVYSAPPANFERHRDDFTHLADAFTIYKRKS